MTDDKFLQAFEACKLTRNDWNHEAHIRMAWLYLVRSTSHGQARIKVRAGIKRLNKSFAARVVRPCQPRAKDDSSPGDKGAGYHETITIAFLRLIALRLQLGECFLAFRERNPDLFVRGLQLLRTFYSAERLHSEEAQRRFMEPDLEPLPKLRRKSQRLVAAVPASM